MSIRIDLDIENMDLVMYYVRKLDKNPSEIINLLLTNPTLINEAWSEDENRLTCKKQEKCR